MCVGSAARRLHGVLIYRYDGVISDCFSFSIMTDSGGNMTPHGNRPSEFWAVLIIVVADVVLIAVVVSYILMVTMCVPGTLAGRGVLLLGGVRAGNLFIMRLLVVKKKSCSATLNWHI